MSNEIPKNAAMGKRSVKYPSCYADLDRVFPMGENDLRTTPERCMACAYKTECLRAAMSAEKGNRVREEMVDRAYTSGMIGFLQRWSEKKRLHQKRKTASKPADPKEES
jgi:hypothetical protein